MKNLFYLTLVFLANLSLVQAKTLLISDVDDTLKISHVLDRGDSVPNTFRTGNIFGGINALFRATAQQDPQIKFYYVSNAPKAIMGKLHADFLHEHWFPQGILRLRPNLFGPNYKLAEIRKILKKENPDTLILVGDNGEIDPLVYGQIQKENPTLRTLSYIHLAYYTQAREKRGTPLQEGQVGYVTSWDLMLNWRKEGLLSTEAAEEFSRIFAEMYLKEPENLKNGEVVIPSWFNCRDFKASGLDSELTGSEAETQIVEKLLKRCSRNGRIWD